MYRGLKIFSQLIAKIYIYYYIVEFKFTTSENYSV